jgi:DNA-binding NtrC family response regulator
LVASELFGHERGAFTGAHARHVGAFERADGGTVFLDELGEMPLDIQPLLLGVLERRRLRRVGGRESIPVDVRVIAATHRDLRHRVNEGSFRADLYYRVSVLRIVMPSLRDRIGDLEALVAHFASGLSADDNAPFGRAALHRLRAHAWPGNVRELRNVVEATLALGTVDLSLPAEPSEVERYRDARARVLAEFERSYLLSLMATSKGNASEAARLAEMDRPYLLTLLRRHGLRD